jgi:hypothetical protein
MYDLNNSSFNNDSHTHVQAPSTETCKSMSFQKIVPCIKTTNAQKRYLAFPTKMQHDTWNTSLLVKKSSE